MSADLESDIDAVHSLVEHQRGSVEWQREDGRWYLVHFDVDLFDGPHLALRWGGRYRGASAGKRVRLGPDAQALAREIKSLCRRRRKHGYVLN